MQKTFNIARNESEGIDEIDFARREGDSALIYVFFNDEHRALLMY